jgi:hypothetical protein
LEVGITHEVILLWIPPDRHGAVCGSASSSNFRTLFLTNLLAFLKKLEEVRDGSRCKEMLNRIELFEKEVRKGWYKLVWIAAPGLCLMNPAKHRRQQKSTHDWQIPRSLWSK